jgi:DNA-binding MarR family transcriptional regulator
LREQGIDETDLREKITLQLRQLSLALHHTFLFGGLGPEGCFHPHAGQGRVLAMLKLKPVISQKELSFLMGMSKQGLAELLSKLEKNGYVTRENEESDRRAVTVRLTPEGEAAAERLEERKPVLLEVFDCFSQEELVAFSAFLDRLAQRFKEKYPPPDFDKKRAFMDEFARRHCHPPFGESDLRDFSHMKFMKSMLRGQLHEEEEESE